jgi:hypothetical protein
MIDNNDKPRSQRNYTIPRMRHAFSLHLSLSYRQRVLVVIRQGGTIGISISTDRYAREWRRNEFRMAKLASWMMNDEFDPMELPQ